ncbi:hypothetical protein D3260_08140 [Salinisphaera sp. Q1T1-3]|nr:hypothetical protein D3260_08140 [Salinisphaera sp. Q1T1-3]
MPRDDTAPADNTAEIQARLRRLERRGGLLFIATPLALLLLGGRDLAGLTIFIWPAYAVIYLGLFRRVTRRFDDADWIVLSRSSRRYTLRRLCEVMLLLYALGFAMYGCERARDVLGDDTPAATASLEAPAGAPYG